MRIEGHTGIVTGGGSGLGAATAKHMASLGAKVAIFDLDTDRGASIASEIGGIVKKVDVEIQHTTASNSCPLRTLFAVSREHVLQACVRKLFVQRRAARHVSLLVYTAF